MLTAVVHIADIKFRLDTDTDGVYVENEEILDVGSFAWDYFCSIVVMPAMQARLTLTEPRLKLSVPRLQGSKIESSEISKPDLEPFKLHQLQGTEDDPQSHLSLQKFFPSPLVQISVHI